MTYLRYVAIGDSTTEGLEDPYPTGVHPYAADGHSLSVSHPDRRGSYRGWSDRLAEHIATAQGAALDYANLAVRGYKLPDIRHEQFDLALSMNPDLMTIVGGVNDAARLGWNPHATRGHLSYMFKHARDRGIEVLTFTMPDPAAINWMVVPFGKNIHELNEITRSEAARFGVRVLDVAEYPIGVDPRLWHADRLHASTLGHERIGRGLAYTLGINDRDTAWSDPLPPMPSTSWLSRRQSDVAWVREYFIPFIQRHRRGESMGDGLSPKRPTLTPMPPAAT